MSCCILLHKGGGFSPPQQWQKFVINVFQLCIFYHFVNFVYKGHEYIL